MILYKMFHGMYAAVNRTAMILLVTEVLSQRALLILCYVESMLYKLINALVLCGRNRNDRYA